MIRYDFAANTVTVRDPKDQSREPLVLSLSLPQAERDEQINVYLGPEPGPRILTPLQFRNLFTPEERGTFTQAAFISMQNGDPTLQVFLDDLSAAVEVDLDNAQTIAGFDAFVAAGIITQARRDEILGA